MGRRFPWILFASALPAAVLIVAGFLAVTPFGWQMFTAGIVLLAAADAIERRHGLPRT